MLKEQRERLLKRLKGSFSSNEEILAWMRGVELVKSAPITYYVYLTEDGDYLGDDFHDDDQKLIDIILMNLDEEEVIMEYLATLDDKTREAEINYEKEKRSD